MNCLEFTNDYDDKFNYVLRDHLRYFLNSPLYLVDDIYSDVEIPTNLVIGLNFRQHQIYF